MFGYLICNKQKLSEEEYNVYHSYYCGLCNRLFSLCGNEGRKTVSYDLAFVGILLTGLYHPADIAGQERCPIHFITAHDYRYNDYLTYAAKMNIVLTYYKQLDDYHDDNDQRAFKRAGKLKTYVEEIRKEYPEKLRIIEECLQENSRIEAANILNPDIPANCFGNLFAEVLYRDIDDFTPLLKRFGFYLGKFIYLMDACLDLRDDLKNGNYNCLTAVSSTDYGSLLEMVMADCVAAYNQLPLSEHQHIIENVLYSGIWTQYDLHFRMKKGPQDA